MGEPLKHLPRRLLRGALRLPARRVRRWLGVPAPVERVETAYVAFLSDEAHNYVRRLQLSIRDRYGSNPGLGATPHVTLKLGFPVADLAPFAAHLDELAAGTAPVEIRLRGFGFFEDGIAFLDVETNPALEQLRRRVLDELRARHGVQPYPLEGDAYRFHVTVAYGLGRAGFERLRGELARESVEFRFPLRALGLLCDTGTHWVTYRRASLA